MKLFIFLLISYSNKLFKSAALVASDRSVSLTNQYFDVKLYEKEVLIQDNKENYLKFSLSSNQILILTTNFTRAPVDYFYMKINTNKSFSINISGHSNYWNLDVKEKCGNPYLLLNNSVYYKCIDFSRDQAATINSSLKDSFIRINKQLMWWNYFDQLQIKFNGPVAINISNVSLYGWQLTSNTCNCFIPGVKNISNPCDKNGECICRKEFNQPRCMYTLNSLTSANYGPYNKALLGIAKTLLNFSHVLVGISDCSFKNPEIGCHDGTSENYTYCLINNINTSHIGMDLPITICWGERICKILDGYFYIPKPAITYISFNMNKTIKNGGLEVNITGSNLDSVASPMLFLISCKSKTTNPRNCECRTSYSLKSPWRRTCRVNQDGNMMTCYSPPINKTDNFIYYSIDNSLMFSQQITVYENPHINLMEQETMDFKEDYCYRIMNNYMLLDCCRNSDYNVTVGDDKAEICEIVPNFISFKAPLVKPRQSEGYNNGTSKVDVSVGEFTKRVGYIRYERAPNYGAILGSVLGSISLLSIILFVLFLFCVLKRKKMLCFKELVRPPVKTLLDRLNEPLRTRVKRCLVTEDVLDVGEEIGKGNFGKVNLGKFKGQHVAIKTLSDPDANYKQKKEFLEEAVRMMDFNHNNVLKLIAIVIVRNTPKVILPFMKHGDLLGFLHKFESIIPTMMIGMTRDVVSGMEYLAAMSYVHRDLAARNCMVDGSMTVKVGDFGLARDIYHQYYYKIAHLDIPLPYKWMPIECLNGKMELRFSEKTDVWSFGILMWEIFTKGDNPYIGMSHQALKMFLISGKRLNIPPFANDALYKIMLSCWDEIPTNRPSFKTLKELINKVGSTGINDHHIGIDNIDHGIDNNKITSIHPPRDIYLTPTNTDFNK